MGKSIYWGKFPLYTRQRLVIFFRDTIMSLQAPIFRAWSWLLGRANNEINWVWTKTRISLKIRPIAIEGQQIGWR
jgi:hypothetical protein